MKKRKIRIKFRFLCLVAYILASLVLIAEASMNGKLSSSQSNAVGGTIADIVNGTAQDQTQAVLPESLIINNKNSFSLGYVGDEIKLDSTTLPENSTYKEKRYVSSNPDVASVSVTVYAPSDIPIMLSRVSGSAYPLYDIPAFLIKDVGNE